MMILNDFTNIKYGQISIANMGIGYEQLHPTNSTNGCANFNKKCRKFQQDISAFIKQMGGLTGLNVQNVQKVLDH